MELFYELVQIAIGTREKISSMPSEKEWFDIYNLSQKHALGGIIFLALDKLSYHNLKPPINLLYDWIGLFEHIKLRNEILNQQCVEITKIFSDAGFKSCILKGQGNALMYPNPLSRISGDIDIWVEGSRQEIKDFVFAQWPYAEDGPMHISFPYNNVEIEVHYYPRRLPIRRYDNRFQLWCKEQKEAQFSNYISISGCKEKVVSVPTLCFSVVHQLSHIMGHLLGEGIGLRQLVDYYYLLIKQHKEGGNENYEKLFGRFGLLKIARGVMWIENEVLGLNKDYLIVNPDKTIGKLIMHEIEKRRISWDFGRLLKLVYYFPEEMMWKLIRKIEDCK